MISKYFPLLICVLFLSSCAKQSAPTGGPKDTIPPRLVQAIPDREAINFKGRSIELEFSETVILNNPKEQLIITPSIGKEFDIKARNKTVILNIPHDLENNTTYTLNFRDAVQDITEKNPAKNLQLAFSTGPYIDSLSLSGSVSDILNGKELKEITVALHPPNDTFNIFKHPAIIFTKSNDKGYFVINHLKPGTYYIYAFDDKNKNLYIDSKTEMYGFIIDRISLKNDTSKINMGLVKLDARPLKLTSSRPYNSYFNIRASKMLSNYSLTTGGDADVYSSFGEDQSNIKVFNTFQSNDSTLLKLSASDSIGNKIDTTVYAKFIQREVTPEKFDASIKSASVNIGKGLLKATISFTKPIREINFDSLYIQIDSATIIRFTKEDISWTEIVRELKIEKQLDKKLFESNTTSETTNNQTTKSTKPKKSPRPQTKQVNSLYMGKGAFISAESDSTKKMTQALSLLKAEDLSLIEYDIKTRAKNIVIQLLDKNRKVMQEKTNILKGKFEDLPAGDYMMRVIIDRDGDGKWSPGNYFNKKEPEPIIYYKDAKGSQSIPLKANWELVLAPMLTTY